MTAFIQLNRRAMAWTRIFRILTLALCLIAGTTCSATAGVILSFEAPKIITAGGMTTLDLYIQSSDPNDLSTLDSFSLQLQITGGIAGELQFVSPQSDAQWTDNVAFASYVFNVPDNDSFNRVNMTSVTTVGTTVNINDTYVGGDQRAVFDFTVIVPSNPVLLAQVNLLASLNALGTFDIDVIGDSFTQFVSIDPMDVTQPGLDPLTFNLPVTGEVTVVPAIAPVPEPSTLALFTMIGTGLLVRSYRRRA